MKHFYRLIQGDCRVVLPSLEANSIDCAVTDPPYGIGFMGKDWDLALPPKEAFAEMFRVLKPGALAFVMSSPRQDVLWRMLKMLEDCGFQLRQSFVSWIYKCVSEDTDVLTLEGWKGIDELDQKDIVCTFNKEQEQLEYQPLKNIFRYNYDGKLVNIQNRDTDQLLTPNHRVLHKDRKHSGNRRWNGKWEFTEVQKLISHCGVNLPLAYPYKDYELSIGEDFAELLGWVLGEGWEQKESDAVNISQSEKNLANVIRIRRLLERLGFKYSEYSREREYNGEPYIEYQFHIHAKYGKKIRKWIPNGEPTLKLLHLPYNERQALFEALIRGEGSGELGSNLAFYQKSPKFREWFQLLCLHQGYQTSTNSDEKQYVGVSPRHTTQLQHRHFNPEHKECRVREIDYNGSVWCVETDNDTFVARRNHKIFITGNSGFPKAYDVSLGIDTKFIREEFLREHGRKPTREELKKLLKEKRKVVGKRWETNRRPSIQDTGKYGKYNPDDGLLIEPSSDLAKKWQGWKSFAGLKPALECVLMVNKPLSEKTIVDNVLKHGTGAMNVDACRIPFQSKDDFQTTRNKTHKDYEKWISRESIVGQHHKYGDYSKTVKKGIPIEGNPLGRFPANLLVSDKALDLVSQAKNNVGHYSYKFKKAPYDGGWKSLEDKGYLKDVGGPSRYFDLDAWAGHHGFLDVPKASKSEREEGLEGLKHGQKYADFGLKVRMENGRATNKRTNLQASRTRNVHPTVKPVKLGCYLIQLGCPPQGVVLDPFVGTGTFMKSAIKTGRSCIAVEVKPEYCMIAKERCFGKAFMDAYLDNCTFEVFKPKS